MVIGLKPEHEGAYRRFHAAVWPEVLEMIRRCNIANYTIFHKDSLLFSYFEYHGTDLEADFELMASDPKTQEWWAIMKPMQEPFKDREPNEWWSEMDDVFHMD
jgi:L-rhamnose mutarotase